MTDGVTAPKVGDTVTYTVTLVDRGSEPLSAQIRIAAPDGLADLAVTHGDLTGRVITWNARITAGDPLRLHFAATVTGPARLAVTACAYTDAGGRPIACASDLDQAVRPTTQHNSAGLLIIGGIVLLALLAGAGMMWRRSRRGQALIGLDDPRTTYDQRDYTDASP